MLHSHTVRRNEPARAGGSPRCTQGDDAPARPTLDASMNRTNYRLAKRAIVRQVTMGALPPAAVCDAHPELLRAARNIGQPTSRSCPICRLADDRAEVPTDETNSLRLVTYVYGDDLRRLSDRKSTRLN